MLNRRNTKRLMYCSIIIFQIFSHSCGINTNQPGSSSTLNAIDSIDLVTNPEWFYFGITEERIVNSNGKYENGVKTGVWQYFVDNKYQDSITWRPSKIQQFSFCIPTHWQVEKTNNALFLAHIPDYIDSYFAILEHTREFPPIEYVGRLYNSSVDDTTERITSFTAKGIEVNNLPEACITYSASFSRDTKIWKAFGLAFSHNEKIYDIAMRVEQKNHAIAEWDKLIFTDIINSVGINKTPVIPSMEDVRNIYDIDFE